MKSFYFNLVARPRYLFWVRGSMFLLGSAALASALGYWQWVLYPALSIEREQVRTEAAKLDATGVTSNFKPADLAKAWQQARDVSVQLGLPWQQLFVALGDASNSGNVALISIEPDPLKGHVVLVVEARNLGSMLKFVSDLQGSSDFSGVTLQSHTINKAVPEKPVRFRVAATWRTTE
jgi:hypothetical protein